MVRLRQRVPSCQALDESKRVADIVPVAILRITPVCLAVCGRGKETAHVARRQSPSDVRVHEVGKGAGVALGHEEDDADARIEAGEQLPQLGHGEGLLVAPESNPIVREVCGVFRAVIGHVEQQGIARAEMLSSVFKPGTQRCAGSRLEGEPVNDGILVPDRCLQGPFQACSPQEPEIGFRLHVAQGEVSFGVGAIGIENRHVGGRDPGAA